MWRSLPWLSSTAPQQVLGAFLDLFAACCSRHFDVVTSDCPAYISVILSDRRYWYFGDRTSAIITRDLSLRAPFAGHSVLVKGLTVVRIVDIFVAVNAYTTYPLLVVVLQVH